jgi:hypothetical protein
LAGLLLPGYGSQVLHSLLRRSGYAADEEQEAELLASMLLERLVARRATVPPGGHAGELAAALLGRLEAALA